LHRSVLFHNFRIVEGFNVADVIEKPAEGSGVQNIMNRIHALQGRIEFSSAEGEGMHARLRIPI